VDLYRWALGARRGERIRYWTDIGIGLPERFRENAHRASDGGLIFLAQRRVRGQLHYEATRIGEQTAKRLGLIGHRDTCIADAFRRQAA
jgi:hypothetical protein